MSVRRTLLASASILVAGVVTLAATTDGFQAYTTETARRLDVRSHPRLLPAVPLKTAAGDIVDFSMLRGRWLMVDFIYTRCPTYCSVQGNEFAQLQDRMAAQIARGNVLLLSISFDPQHDSPTELAAYQRRSGDRGAGWVAASPTSARDLATLMRLFGIVAVPDELGGYVHNAAIAVVNPAGRLETILDWNDARGAQQYILARLAS